MFGCKQGNGDIIKLDLYGVLLAMTEHYFFVKSRRNECIITRVDDKGEETDCCNFNIV